MTTPASSTDDSSDDNSDSSEEARILKLLKDQYAKDEISNEEFKKDIKEFKGLSYGTRLKKLDELVKRSQLFSSVIADTLLESSLKATQPVKEEVKEAKLPPRKKRKSTNAKLVQPTLTDLMNRRKTELKQRPNIGQPKLITGCRMKDYQVTGMQWLVSLYQNGLNGILADEMGLGKTLESISMLAFLYEQGITGPFLICCPLSTVSNWINEFHRFAPTFKALAYVGPKDKRVKLRRKFKSSNVIVTSYELSIRDFKYLENREWKYLIVDEGHRLKNTNCLLIQQLRKIRTSNRLLLTGTPLQNNLNELWSLLNFILPEIFRDAAMFQQWFEFGELESLKDETGSKESEKFNEIVSLEIQKTLVKNLHTILKPFLLRRLKKDVIRGLPPKREYIVYSKLSEKQAQLYQAILSRNFRVLLYKESFKDYVRLNGFKSHYSKTYSDNQLDKYVENQLLDDFPKSDPNLDEDWKFVKRQVSHKKLQNIMMQLRLVCDCPYLFFFPWNDDTKLSKDLVKNSCKLQILDQLVPELIQNGHRILIFSQFTGMLDIIQQYLTELHDIGCSRIDGSTSQADREQFIDDFNSPDSNSSIFLLSTRAGGLGINLTAADTVVLFDSDWNPQVDLQAMDRVHRIGQKKPVIVYRLVCANTIEEFLLAKADSKRRLEKLVIQLGDFHTLLGSPSNKRFKFTDDKNPSISKNNDELLDNLKKFLSSKKVHTKEIEDNRLSAPELKELLDRSQNAYSGKSNTKTDGDEKSHISLFETVTAMD